jgi:hypothetical protein
MLKLVLFIHQESGQMGDRLKDAIGHAFTTVPQEYCDSIDGLKDCLKHPAPYGAKTLYMVFADTIERLNRLAGLEEYLEDRRLVLILPDNEASTWSTGLKLRPRFLASVHGSLNDVVAVLSKMIGAPLMAPSVSVGR